MKEYGKKQKKEEKRQQRKGMGNEVRNNDQGIREGIKKTGDEKEFRSRRRRKKRIRN